MGFKTRGRVTGHSATRDTTQTAQGSLFTQVEATNAEQGGTLATAQVYADGSGWVSVKVDGKLVHEFAFTPSGKQRA